MTNGRKKEVKMFSRMRSECVCVCWGGPRTKGGYPFVPSSSHLQLHLPLLHSEPPPLFFFFFFFSFAMTHILYNPSVSHGVHK